MVTQDDLELDTIDSQEIVYDDNSSDNSDCQVRTQIDCSPPIMSLCFLGSCYDTYVMTIFVALLILNFLQGLAVLPGVVEGLSNGRLGF